MRTGLGFDERRESEAFADLFFEENNSAKLKRASSLVVRVIGEELTERQRQCLSLYYFSGLTMPQIARELGINKSSVSRAIVRAKARIERSMKYAMQMNGEVY